MKAQGVKNRVERRRAATVSIVLPTFNGSRYLRESLDSCLNQTFDGIELIVVDDGSTDETPKILEEYKDPRLRVIRHRRNLKLPSALNSGFAASVGEYLTWTSDDNRYHAAAIETMLAALRARPDVGLVYAGMRLIDEFGRLIREEAAEPPEMLQRKSVVGACFLYRRSVYQQIGDYNESLFRIEDYDYWLRIAQRFKIAPLSEILYDYRVHPASLTSEESLRERAKAWDDLHSRINGPSPGRYESFLGELYISKAFSDYSAGRYSQVAGSIIRGLRCDPKYLWNRGVVSIFFRSLGKMGRGAKADPGPA